MRTFYINLIFFVSFIIIILATLGWVIFLVENFPNVHWVIKIILAVLGGYSLGANLLKFTDTLIKLLKI